jgi:sugar/nucleoside kinase (ribokinase family)
MMKVLILGGTSYDEIIRLTTLPNPIAQTLFAPSYHAVGSTGAGKALAMKRLNIDVTLHSLIGEDEEGKQIQLFLAHNRVPFYYDIVKETERHINLIDESGTRISIFTSFLPENPSLNFARLEELISTHDLIVLNIIPYTKQLIPIIKKWNKPVWTDLHDYQLNDPYYDDFIQVAKGIFLSNDRIDDIALTAKHLMQFGSEFVVVTMGHDGSELFVSNEQVIYEPILNRFPHVDSSGAGDSFFSGYLFGYLRKEPWEECMKFGTICGGMAVSSKELASEDLTSETVLKIKETYYE